MYLSLKGSLGHTPITDRVGEGPLQIAEGAAAAYSLRNLGSDSPSVVRVRRESDNNERDFTAQDISTSVLTNWVNQQITPPLDLRELTATGRDGPIIEAAAAYSLRNLSDSYAGDVVEVRRNTDGALKDFKASEVTDGTLEAWVNTSFANALPLDTASGAAAAYSLRNLSSSYTGSVVDVRRSSDGNTETFTAAEVTDGTLVTWVNAVGVARNRTGSAKWGSFTPTATGFNASASGAAACGYDVSGLNGASIQVSFDIAVNSGSVTIMLRSGFESGSTVSNTLVANTSGSKSITLTATSDFVALQFISASANIEVTNFSIDTPFSNDGTVSKWYDQSGNDNHAVQGTPASQPKIVDGGSLVAGGIDFDGTDDFLAVSGEPVITASSSGTYSAFSVQTVASTGEVGYLYGNASGGNGSSLYAAVLKFSLSNTNTINLDSIARSTGTNLLSAVYNNGDAGLLVNGAGNMTSSGTYTFPAGSSNFLIGNRNGGTSSGTFLNGAIQEIIVYNSDQSDKRRAIEENIGSNYGITLTSSKDGTVSKWYDQSTTSGVPNAKHAVQTSASKQPKIVSGGSLLDDIDFAGSKYLQTTSLQEQIPVSLFSVNRFDSTLTGFRPFISNGILDGFSYGYGLFYNDPSNLFRTQVRTPSTASQFDNSATTVGDVNSLTTALMTVSTLTSFYNGGNQTSVANAEGAITPNRTLTLGGSETGGTPTVTRFFEGGISEVILYPSDQTDNRTALEANIGEVYGIAGIPAYDDTVNGFVETWYDQSGNGKNATQLTAGNQPKIVDSGTLVTGGLDFDGVNFLGITGSAITSLDSASSFLVGRSDTVGGTRIALTLSTHLNSKRWYMPVILSGTFRFGYAGSATAITLGTADTDEHLFTAIAGTSIATAYYDGVSKGTLTSTSGVAGSDAIGSLGGTINWVGKIQEVIIYNTDQTANRPAIEANINNQYDIY